MYIIKQMDLFKKYWYKNESKLRGYVVRPTNQPDYQSAFISQAKK